MTQEPCIPIGCVVCPQMSLSPPQNGSWGWKIIEMGQWGKDFGIGTAKKKSKNSRYNTYRISVCYDRIWRYVYIRFRRLCFG